MYIIKSSYPKGKILWYKLENPIWKSHGMIEGNHGIFGFDFRSIGDENYKFYEGETVQYRYIDDSFYVKHNGGTFFGEVTSLERQIPQFGIYKITGTIGTISYLPHVIVEEGFVIRYIKSYKDEKYILLDKTKSPKIKILGNTYQECLEKYHEKNLSK